jgi:hypothetical protein
VVISATSPLVAVLRSRRTRRWPLVSPSFSPYDLQDSSRLNDLDLIAGVKAELGPQMRRYGHLTDSIRAGDFPA